MLWLPRTGILEIINRSNKELILLEERDDGTENQQDQDAFSLPPGCTIDYRSSLIALLVDQWFFVLALFLVLIWRSLEAGTCSLIDFCGASHLHAISPAVRNQE